MVVVVVGGEGLAVGFAVAAGVVGFRVGFAVGVGVVGLSVSGFCDGASVSGIFGGVGLPMLEFWRGQSSHVAVGLSHLQPATRQVSALTYSGQSFARSGSLGSSSGTKTPKLSARYGRTAAAPSVAVPRDAAPTPRRRESANTFCASGSALSGSAGLRGRE